MRLCVLRHFLLKNQIFIYYIVASDLLLVEVCGRGDVCPGAGGGGEAGRVVHDGVAPGPHPRPRHLATHVVISARVPALLVLVTWVNIKALLLVLEDNKPLKSPEVRMDGWADMLTSKAASLKLYFF